MMKNQEESPTSPTILLHLLDETQQVRVGRGPAPDGVRRLGTRLRRVPRFIGGGATEATRLAAVGGCDSVGSKEGFAIETEW
jgi:hypothetical protein